MKWGELGQSLGLCFLAAVATMVSTIRTAGTAEDCLSPALEVPYTASRDEQGWFLLGLFYCVCSGRPLLSVSAA